jgi:seryl-tRNA synthetase
MKIISKLIIGSVVAMSAVAFANMTMESSPKGRAAKEALAQHYAQQDAEKKAAVDKLEADRVAKIKALPQAKRPGVSLGMSQDEVIKLTQWGKPDRVNRTTNARGVSEQWVYNGGGYLYFDNGVLRSIQN